MRSRTDLIPLSLALIGALSAAVTAAPPTDSAAKPASAKVGESLVATPKEIDFADSLEMAKAIVADRPRPIVIQFGATWCGWCRKLETETLKDPQVVAMASRFGWVHADVDQEKDLASQYGARALPYAVVIDDMGQVLSESRGFSDAKGYLAFLAQGEAGYVPTSTASISSEAVPERVRTLVTTMAPASASGRQQCIEAIRRLGPAALPVLVELLGNERLALRAAAGFALTELAKANLSFDPMASAEDRAARVTEWKAWLGTDEAKSLRAVNIGGTGSVGTRKDPKLDPGKDERATPKAEPDPDPTPQSRKEPSPLRKLSRA